MNGFRVIGEYMVYIYDSKGIPTLHGYLLSGETIEHYLMKHNIFADLLGEC